jgi:hypothetical protein
MAGSGASGPIGEDYGRFGRLFRCYRKFCTSIRLRWSGLDSKYSSLQPSGETSRPCAGPRRSRAMVRTLFVPNSKNRMTTACSLSSVSRSCR